ncbi:MAG TPA: carbohydrate ABC transporter permease [Casimicrobiaceae bacterium]|jgi:multiple sugar transport system permease protein|nr:carbohydrate ABC transporter permease [Casimicrobiaceae bacterium]
MTAAWGRATRKRASAARMSASKRATLWALAALSLFYLLAPPGWMLISSFSPVSELYSRPPHWIPHAPTVEHYATLFQTAGANAAALSENPQVKAFPRSFANSLIIALATTLICVSFGSISAYTLSRFVERQRQKTILLGLLATRMIPVVSILIPIYFALQRMGLLDTLSGLVLVYSGLLLPFVIWILEAYYRDFPRELEEAASIDGCSPVRAFVSIVLPLSRNGLFAAAAFVFISVWSDFIVGLTLTSSPRAWPLSVALAQALNPIAEPNWGLLNAEGLVAALVPAALAFMFRGAVMRGMLSGAVKG